MSLRSRQLIISWKYFCLINIHFFSFDFTPRNNELRSQFKHQSRRNIDVFKNYIDSSICWFVWVRSKREMKNYWRSEIKYSSINNHKKSILFWMSVAAAEPITFPMKSDDLIVSELCKSHLMYPLIIQLSDNSLISINWDGFSVMEMRQKRFCG